ncbi:MAG: GntP family permease [Pseudomonadota bacterium]
MIGLFGILLALGLLIYLAFRGVSVLVLGPVMALLAAAFSLEPGLATYTQIFMPAMGSFAITYFPIFLLGAIFGRFMETSGAARSIANGVVARLGEAQAIPAVVVACAVLTYGGVSLFVVAFAVYPIAVALFLAADIPKRLIPAAIALGAFTFTMTALPGTPAIQNAIPMPYFGTTSFAAPGLGLIAAIILASGGLAWLRYREKRAATNGESYGYPEDRAVPDCPEEQEAKKGALPSFWIAALPIAIVITLNYLLSVHLFPALDTAYLLEPRFGPTTIGEVRGIWAIVIALGAATILLYFLNRKRMETPINDLNTGAGAAVMPIFNTASLVGFGAVIAGLPAFAEVTLAVENLGGGPIISLAIATSILAGLTGSASGGMTIALEAVGDRYLEQAQALGLAPDILHRVTTLATGGLDALPHNGAVITLLSICGLTHKESYTDIAIVAVVVPLIALVVVIVLGTLFGSF